ncbi:PD-(D/E)XK nuclease family protein [Vibrio breoganii]
MDTQLTRFEQLLAEFEQLEPFVAAEPTIFSIGSKGYFENPTTDILAFFCDSNGQHQLGDTALKAMLNCLPDEYHSLDSFLVEKPEREVRTEAGKRIDLLLESSDWVLVLENKIYHQQNNPFDHYERFVEEEQNQTRLKSKQKLFVVLSPSGTSPSTRWHGISYSQLIVKLKANLADQFISQPINKWTLLLREFILHLESLMSQPQLSLDTLDFVLDNLHQIKQLQETKVSTIELYQQTLHQQLQEELDVELFSKVVYWSGYPAIRFAYQDWPTDSDVVLFLDARKGNSFCINYYCGDINNDEERKIADEHFHELDCDRPWNEVEDTCRCYKARFDEYNQDTACKKIAHKLRIMDRFEKEIRPTLKIDRPMQSRGLQL